MLISSFVISCADRSPSAAGSTPLVATLRLALGLQPEADGAGAGCPCLHPCAHQPTAIPIPPPLHPSPFPPIACTIPATLPRPHIHTRVLLTVSGCGDACRQWWARSAAGYCFAGAGDTLWSHGPQLLSRGADPDAGGVPDTALATAAAARCIDVVHALLRHGANPARPRQYIL
jgi:hypothetical protein